MALLAVATKPKKIVFDEDGEGIAVDAKSMSMVHKQGQGTTQKVHKPNNDQQRAGRGEAGREVVKLKREKQRKHFKSHPIGDCSDGAAEDEMRAEETTQKWFNVYPQFSSNSEPTGLKNDDQMKLFNTCKGAYESERPKFNKRNPSDAHWLQTALQKGTAKDRANAGALLVTSNPLGNLEALAMLISFCRPSNKSSMDVIGVLTDLWREVLLPAQRKLVSLQNRATDWEALKKDTALTKEQQQCIYAYWYYENELKEQYFEFLKTLQQSIQAGQDHNKNAAIIAAAKLLIYAPEKEQLLLTMLINKLGDPSAKIASKALYHLIDVAHRHPNMSGVIVAEAEKLLFRNNISERAQHFTLCFLASIAPQSSAEVCGKLVHVCFALFKVLVQRGAVNNRTMQAILRCLQQAIPQATPADGGAELLSKDMQDTIYRLVHLADVRVSVQTLGLLLQLVAVHTMKSDRFYNAIYKRLGDMDLTGVGAKTAAQLLHIIHRAIHLDGKLPRALAFIKRLLQMALYMPAHIAAGCLIVVHKLLRNRNELTQTRKQGETGDNVAANKENELSEVGADILKPGVHNDNNKYKPFHRVPAFAGAEHALRTELFQLQGHYHPTVQVFATNILNQKRIDYYGDPLRDFGIAHFLERFAFKNPKKLDRETTADTVAVPRKPYTAAGTRGQPVTALTKTNCTEDEKFIFNYLEQKRKWTAATKTKSAEKGVAVEAESEDALQPGEVDDDEFEQYLDEFFGKKAKLAEVAEENDEDKLDFLKELGGKLDSDKLRKSKFTIAVDNPEGDVADADADWGDDDSGTGSDAGGSIDLDESEDADSISMDDSTSLFDEDVEEDISEPGSDEDDNNDDEDFFPPKSKKARDATTSTLDQKNFAKKLKHSNDMSSLFAAADDFADLLDETAKTKGQGTANALSNKDRSTEKQLRWEERRHSHAKNYSKIKLTQQVGSRKEKSFGKQRR